MNPIGWECHRYIISIYYLYVISMQYILYIILRAIYIYRDIYPGSPGSFFFKTRPLREESSILPHVCWRGCYALEQKPLVEFRKQQHPTITTYTMFCMWAQPNTKTSSGRCHLPAEVLQNIHILEEDHCGFSSANGWGAKLVDRWNHMWICLV